MLIFGEQLCLSMDFYDQAHISCVVRKSREIYGTYFFQVRNRGLREGATHLLVARLHVPTHSNNRVVFFLNFVVAKQG
jgi:hypothetical protein